MKAPPGEFPVVFRPRCVILLPVRPSAPENHTMTAYLAGLALLLSGPAPAAADTLEARLAPLARAHKGKVAVAVKHLGNGQCWTLNGDDPMPTASLIKFPVMIEVYQQAAEGKVKLGDKVTLRESDKVPGSGILTYHF